MKQVEITVLERDIENVITFLGRRGELQFSYTEAPKRNLSDEERETGRKRDECSGHIKTCARFLEIDLPKEPGESARPAGEAEEAALAPIWTAVSALEGEEYNLKLEKERIEDNLRSLAGFEDLPEDLAERDSLSFLNLKIGRLAPEKQEEVRKNLGNRAVIVPLGTGGDEVLVASSKKGRFAMDSELKKQEFAQTDLPKNLQATPSETVNQLRVRYAAIPEELNRVRERKNVYRETFGASLRSLAASYLMADVIADIKNRLVATQNARMLSGWLPDRSVSRFVSDLDMLTEGRIAVICRDPWEAPGVIEGREKIPVKLKHGRFARGFQPLVFSYGAPLYGTIDPTSITAFFFTLLFAIMFGDVGQGFVLLLLGLIAGNPKIGLLAKQRHFASPLKAIGIASMFTGLLYGSVFSNEELLHVPTELFTGWLSGTSPGRALGIEPSHTILNLMPHADNMGKIFAFFGCTVAIGVLLNSLGLIINIMNKCSLHKWEAAFFSKTGLAGLAFFWYAVSIAVRAVIRKGKFDFSAVDAAGLVVPILFIVFGHLIMRIASGKRPLFEEGLFAFIMEGIVEILETLSSYISNTVSFLRVGAFALSHAVLSFIIWTMADKVGAAPLGSLWGAIIIVFGNAVIILLEGMIVAIQVTRLQYYEFFSKFFTETGTPWSPFRFNQRR